MALSEGVQASLRFKAYSSGAMSATAEADTASAPGSSGGQELRRVSHTLNLRKATFQSNEIRSDRQIGDYRHGARRVEGSITGDLSPATYYDLIEAAMRGTGVSAVSLTESNLTSATASKSGSAFVFGGGDPVSLGLRVGDVIRFTNLSVAANNSTNFTILSFGGTTNRTVTVSPAPTDMTADTAFNLSRPGMSCIIPASSHVSRLFAFEDYGSDVDISRLFTECRISGFRISLPAEGMASFEAMVMGRGQTVLTGGSAPYFTSPTAITSTGITAGANGLVRVNGTQIGVVTGLDLSLSMNAEARAVLGQLFVPEIFLGTANVTGTLTAMLEDETLLNNFADEDEISILVRADAGAGAAPETISLYLPRIKFTGGDVQRAGEGAQLVTLPFQALRYAGSAAGVDTTTLRIHDTAAS